MIGMLRQRIIRLKTIFTRIVKEYVSFGVSGSGIIDPLKLGQRV